MLRRTAAKASLRTARDADELWTGTGFVNPAFGAAAPRLGPRCGIPSGASRILVVNRYLRQKVKERRVQRVRRRQFLLAPVKNLNNS